MADKGGGAYGAKASDTDFRKKWDKEEYEARAKKRDTEEKERMQDNEERMKQGKLFFHLYFIHSAHLHTRKKTEKGPKAGFTKADRVNETTRRCS